MASLKQKLEYLKETKELIAQAITTKGGTVTPQTSFSDYPDAIREIPQSSDGPGIATVVHDNSLTGNGNQTPLSVRPRDFFLAGQNLDINFGDFTTVNVDTIIPKVPLEVGDIITDKAGTLANIKSINGNSAQVQTFLPSVQRWQNVGGYMFKNQAVIEDIGNIENLVYHSHDLVSGIKHLDDKLAVIESLVDLINGEPISSSVEENIKKIIGAKNDRKN